MQMSSLSSFEETMMKTTVINERTQATDEQVSSRDALTFVCIGFNDAAKVRHAIHIGTLRGYFIGVRTLFFVDTNFSIEFRSI